MRGQRKAVEKPATNRGRKKKGEKKRRKKENNVPNDDDDVIDNVDQRDKLSDDRTYFAMQALKNALPEIVVRPADAYQQMVRGQVEMVPVEALAGRIAAVMVVPYPPGIPVIMPGERFPNDSAAIVDYLRIAAIQDAHFPGFESDIHGARPVASETGERRYFVDCLKEENGSLR